MYSREIVTMLKKAGWTKVSQSGSHLKMRKRN